MSNGKTNSAKVSTLFTSLIKKMYGIIFDHLQHAEDEDVIMHEYGLSTFNAHITSHSSRKATFNTLAQSDVPLYNWIYRVGLDTRNIHTIFDYLNGMSIATDGINGKILSGWTHRNDQGGIDGGHPPDISTLGPFAKQCAEYLFHRHILKGLEKNI